ncbi:hypothetical protein MMC14_005313 [Varicellaria rhodocarpa]|nr:hypothetical protein [Varicellaria rhodocarpa]
MLISDAPAGPGPTPFVPVPLNAPIGPWTARGFPSWPVNLDRSSFNNTQFASSCIAAYNSTLSTSTTPSGVTGLGLCNLPTSQIHQSATTPIALNLTYYAHGEASPTPDDCVAILVVPRSGQNAKCDVSVFDVIYEHYVSPSPESTVKDLPYGGGSWNIDQAKFPGAGAGGSSSNVPPEQALLDTRNPGYALLPRGALNAQMQATLLQLVPQQVAKNSMVNPQPQNSYDGDDALAKPPAAAAAAAALPAARAPPPPLPQGEPQFKIPSQDNNQPQSPQSPPSKPQAQGPPAPVPGEGPRLILPGGG